MFDVRIKSSINATQCKLEMNGIIFIIRWKKMNLAVILMWFRQKNIQNSDLNEVKLNQVISTRDFFLMLSRFIPSIKF